MKIEQIDVFVVEHPEHDRFGGQTQPPLTFPDSHYYFEEEWQEAYSSRTESVFVRISTSDGHQGWGECQAPVASSVTAAVIRSLLGPMLIGRDATRISQLWSMMYRSMNVRGHFTGFMVDAISGLDTALWDLNGQRTGLPVAELLGGRWRSELPTYTSGLRAESPAARGELAAKELESGYAAVKLYLGRGVEADLVEAQEARLACPNGRLLSDLFWKYDEASANRLLNGLGELGFEWAEAPLQPEDVGGHARLVRRSPVPIAVGEPLRTASQFLPWLQAQAMDIAQPDVARCGISGAMRIAQLCDVYRRPVAFHLGVSLTVAIAATWHCSAAIGNFLIQEHEPPMLEIGNSLLLEPLHHSNGVAHVPDGPGLGVRIDEAALQPWVVERAAVR